MRAVVFAIVFAIAACAPSSGSALSPLAGVYKIGGGDASIEIVKALTEAYAAKHVGVKFDIDTSLGSDAAVKLAADTTRHGPRGERPEHDPVGHRLAAARHPCGKDHRLVRGRG